MEYQVKSEVLLFINTFKTQKQTNTLTGPPIVKTQPNPVQVHLASFTRIHLVRVYGSITAGDGPNEREEGGGGDGGEVGDGVGEREGGRERQLHYNCSE